MEHLFIMFQENINEILAAIEIVHDGKGTIG